jgi:hypothetical protein
MRSRSLLAGCLALVPVFAAAARADPSSPEVVLYTIGVGEDPFERFGHSALCLRDPPDADGLCFDYGTADFDDVPRLAWRFLRGDGAFEVSAGAEADLIENYRRRDRSVARQVLPLGADEARRVRDLLLADAEDPGWRYAYRLFDDNCATRVRDVIDRAVGGKLRAWTAGRSGVGRTYRELGREGFAEVPVALVVTDLLLGRRIDREPDRWQAMFLPERLRDEVAVLWGVRPEIVHSRRGPAFGRDPGWGGRGWFLVLAVVLAAPLAAAARFGRGRRAALAGALSIPVFLGCLVWGVAFVSPLPESFGNELLFVFLPFDLVLAFLRESGRRRYARARVGMLAGVSILAAVGWFRQPLWAPVALILLPMAAIAFVRPAGYRPSSGGSGSPRGMET